MPWRDNYSYDFCKQRNSALYLCLAANPCANDGHGYSTVGGILADAGLRRDNEEIQEERLDAAVALFQRETGLSFRAWRQRLRLLAALTPLERGERVTDVALACGYDSTSAFISAFRQQFGCTPGEFFRA